MADYGLGRKRLLDTLFAATWYEGGITRIVTSNVRDYRVFGVPAAFVEASAASLEAACAPLSRVGGAVWA